MLGKSVIYGLDTNNSTDCTDATRTLGMLFTPLSGYCFHPWCPDGRPSGRVGGRREIVCPGCISETERCRKLILGRDIG